MNIWKSKLHKCIQQGYRSCKARPALSKLCCGCTRYRPELFHKVCSRAVFRTVKKGSKWGVQKWAVHKEWNWTILNKITFCQKPSTFEKTVHIQENFPLSKWPSIFKSTVHVLMDRPLSGLSIFQVLDRSLSRMRVTIRGPMKVLKLTDLARMSILNLRALHFDSN